MSSGMPDAPWRVGQQVSVEVPASSANLGPGFDSVGIALDIRDRCTVTITDAPGVEVVVAGEGADGVPRDENHLVVRSMLRAWDVLDIAPPVGMRVECRNAVPHGRGLGSSATAIVTGIGAASAVWRLAISGSADIEPHFVNDLAAQLEGHPDNSSASVWGGATLSWLDDRVDPSEEVRLPHTTTLALSPHPDIRPLVFLPQVQLSTATARSVLPAYVRLGDAAANSARVGVLVHALTREPGYLLAGTHDYLHQEPRRASYAASMALVDALRGAGIAATISGAGPSVLALAVGEQGERAAAYTPEGWRVLDPGFARTGIRVVC